MGGKPADIINLNRARKARARDEKRKAADANALRHGLTKAQKAALKAEKQRAETALDQHRTDAKDTPEGA
ncbi:hypothetical protein PSA7680_00787 [Pseudoruegeria aquimaris]|uniref:DUF4169 domain-containing protein n=1 Tax=Pseudoruegeria aquimaris TaxID=393663 RepID=A0A1Y5RMW4_9RHOB|nr:DUF4169 family protein [Pseudoruegeria aquimaris]SLN21062.1 hypothetical protein PSA7680_00787 [Pseudoruegeria aquimaris]